jgi:alpha-tubulin suppressor-like RCC1 family protein
MPVRLPRGAKILSLASGNDHSLALVLDGGVQKVFVFGANRFGQCAVGNFAHSVSPPVSVWNSKVRAPRKSPISDSSDERVSPETMLNSRVVYIGAKYDNSVVIVEDLEIS